MSMKEYLDTITYLKLTRECRKHYSEKVTESEYTELKYISGEIMWLGGEVSSQVSFVASFLQQCTSDLRLKHLTESNKLLNYLQILLSTLKDFQGDGVGDCTCFRSPAHCIL